MRKGSCAFATLPNSSAAIEDLEADRLAKVIDDGAAFKMPQPTICRLGCPEFRSAPGRAFSNAWTARRSLFGWPTILCAYRPATVELFYGRADRARDRQIRLGMSKMARRGRSWRHLVKLWLARSSLRSMLSPDRRLISGGGAAAASGDSSSPMPILV